MIQSFQNFGCNARPFFNTSRSSSASFICRAHTADFIHTRAEFVLSPLSRLRAFFKSKLARSNSSFSNSNLNAANQMSSFSGFAENASSNTVRAPVTSPCNHRSFAAMSHKISSFGSFVVASRKTWSMPLKFLQFFSSVAASIQISTSSGKTSMSFFRIVRATSNEPFFSNSDASAAYVSF